MRAKELFGITVLDKNVKSVGKIEDVDFDTETGAITNLVISLNKGIFSNDFIEVEFEKIQTIGDYVLLSEEIEAEEKAEEVTIEVEDEE
ncbi:MAG: PRC-barrel domain-containing protein [Methanobrevibacter sp.]|uniref:Photosynthetic reaction center protein n=1 Tax=Methanobrevibacter millerae TaxID=230361 RepID=A0A8T3VD17_9EURY|nr:PRC-barrel domain-containing protein [Methanobrevibacter millerae]MBE6505052.1 photosynthetic reaction center protein [Methanobrevibacter millerae]MBR0059313.1 PRC-barrel domain-containing protein [Methanobrevibacter sp.]MBR0369907.1 PRC-barrel domain-containing protein [Methanobrevibacter sp.]